MPAMNTKKYSIQYGAHNINFSLLLKERKTIGIHVKPDRSVTVTAPLHADIQKVLEKVKKRAPWILKQDRYFSSFNPMETAGKFISGETHRYLGRQYRLKILQAEKNDVKLKGGYIYIFSRSRDNGHYNKKLLFRWYREHAVKKFADIVDLYLKKLKKYGIPRPVVQVKQMKSRWGSCLPRKNKILLNTQLIKAPSQCAAYVIVHELCHLKFPHHDRDFYHLLSLVMPDWEERKKKLDRVFIL
jgi:predicted metal-dependent hydrolase